MALGVVNGTARLEEHNEAWAGMAKELIDELWKALEGYAIDIQHVGSTAIKDIPAKPIIDIAVAVEDVTEVENYIDALSAIGLKYMGEMVPTQRMLAKSTPGVDDRTHHVHIVNIHAKQWEDYLNMRDYCNTHPEAAEAYADLKRKLAGEFAEERLKYKNGKHEFVEALLVEAKKWRDSL